MIEAFERIRCRGDPRVTARHGTTFEVTADPEISGRGDCIIGVEADRGAGSLSGEFRSVITLPDSVLLTTLTCGGITVEIHSSGSPRMTLDHPDDLVWRRSSYVCGRTIGINSEMTARTLPRDLIRMLVGGTPMTVELRASAPYR